MHYSLLQNDKHIFTDHDHQGEVAAVHAASPETGVADPIHVTAIKTTHKRPHRQEYKTQGAATIDYYQLLLTLFTYTSFGRDPHSQIGTLYIILYFSSTKQKKKKQQQFTLL